jgi:uncharacterized protein YgiB involved in biofilm formation
MTQDRSGSRRFTSGKRQRLMLGSIAVASMTLSGCGQEADVQDAQFTTVGECTSAGYPQKLCEASSGAAEAEHQKAAPQFATLAQCQEQWGASSCSSTYRSGGSVFVPLLAGFVLSRAMQRDYMGRGYVSNYGGSYYGSPIYRGRAGNTVTLSKDSMGNITKAPVNVNTRTAAKSGFGGRGMSRSFGG